MVRSHDCPLDAYRELHTGVYRVSDTNDDTASVRALAKYIHEQLRNDMVNQYTAFVPRMAGGVSTIKVKDGRTEKTLRILVMEDE